VLRVACPAAEARRLRTLGIFEGARVGVVSRRTGVVLDVCGSRVALDQRLALDITVRPSET
jgi:Fe2+ transport system protein FeoA